MSTVTSSQQNYIVQKYPSNQTDTSKNNENTCTDPDCRFHIGNQYRLFGKEDDSKKNQSFQDILDSIEPETLPYKVDTSTNTDIDSILNINNDNQKTNEPKITINVVNEDKIYDNYNERQAAIEAIMDELTPDITNNTLSVTSVHSEEYYREQAEDIYYSQHPEVVRGNANDAKVEALISDHDKFIEDKIKEHFGDTNYWDTSIYDSQNGYNSELGELLQQWEKEYGENNPEYNKYLESKANTKEFSSQDAQAMIEQYNKDNPNKGIIGTIISGIVDLFS